MREIVARIVCLLALGMVIALAWVFAARHNPGAGEAGPDRVIASPQLAAPLAPAASAVAADAVERGRAVFAREHCGTCHALAGTGNPRHPLDGVGTRRTPAELQAWITGSGDAAAQLPTAIAGRKQRYTELPAEEMAVLVAFLVAEGGAR